MERRTSLPQERIDEGPAAAEIVIMELFIHALRQGGVAGESNLLGSAEREQIGQAKKEVEEKLSGLVFENPQLKQGIEEWNEEQKRSGRPDLVLNPSKQEK